jgi:hypothetical protein
MSSLDRRAAARQQARFDGMELFAADLDSQPAAELVARRWFAALAATRSLQAECDLLLERLMLADAAWRHAQAHLAEFEAIRDALEREMFVMEDVRAERRNLEPVWAISAA